MRFRRFSLTAIGIAVLLMGLAGSSLASAQDDETIYGGTLTPMNADLSNAEISGDVTFTIDGDELTIHVHTEGAAPGIQHWQHIHGFVAEDQGATCPTPENDANGDGIVDLIETEAVSGTTMIPLNEAPASMEVPTDTYPVADADGAYTYDVTVSLGDLEQAFTEAFPDEQLNLENRVVYIHGVPETTELPDSVASLGDIPAHVTIPIACAELDPGASGATPVATPLATPAS